MPLERAEADRYLAAGDQVVLLFREGGRGKSSGAPIEHESAIIFAVRDGKIVGVHAYHHRAEALDAAGLSE